MTVTPAAEASAPGYDLDRQIGFLLRQAYQRHAIIFANLFGEEFTPTQWATVAKLNEVGECSQNLLGRLTAMDVATIKGVVERLAKRGFVSIKPDTSDRRRVVVALTGEGRSAYERCVGIAQLVTEETLAPLKARDRDTLARLLAELR